MRRSSGRALAFGTVLLVLAITLAPPLQRYFAQRAQINSLQSKLNESRKALVQAAGELALWNDPKYVASQARSRLHFVYPGERQYIVLGVPDNSNKSSTPAAPVAEQIPLGLPWYSRVISSITSTNVNP
jgi:cell division protein FtsB